MAEIDPLLYACVDEGGSDLHLAIGSPPKIRLAGELVALEHAALTPEHIANLIHEICPPEDWDTYIQQADLDFAYEIEGFARFRANYLYNHFGMAAVFRQIPAKILTFEQLKLPDALMKLCDISQGLVFVTGPTGCGKSTTMAAMIDYINKTQRKHIITFEDPIEFVHESKESTIIHREIGVHANSFASALRGALHADADILFIGELRDLETIKLALTCAAMGMLVYGTMHTNNAPKTIDRVIDAFPAEEQDQIRALLSECLKGVVSQLLCKRADAGRIAVHEILLPHMALKNSIRSGAIANIRGIIESSGSQGMCSMDSVLKKRMEEEIITPKEAYMKAADKSAFVNFLPEDMKIDD